MRTSIAMLAATLLVSTAARAQNTVHVTIDNFAQAESDLYFGNAIKEAGVSGNFSTIGRRLPSISNSSFA